MKARLCPKCGNHNSENAWSCSVCGETLSVDSIVEVETKPPQTQELESPTDPRESTGLYCSNCGQKLNKTAKFCSMCGTKVEETIPNINQDQEPKQDAILCPICGYADKLEKVSAIVSKDTHDISGTSREWVSNKDGGGYWSIVPISETQISTLAQQLTPPPQPQIKEYSGCDYIGRILGLVMAFIFLVVGLSDLDAFIVYIPFILLFGIPGILGVNAKNKHDDMEKARIAKEEPIWRSAMEIWSRLYYCYRDDLVFDHIAKKTCQPRDIIAFCYQKEYSEFVK